MPTSAKPSASFWGQPIAELFATLGSNPHGLTESEAASRLASVGPNELVRVRRGALLWLFLSRFRNPLVIVLLVASAISAATGDVASFAIITVMVLMSVTLDTVQEYRAGQAADRLKLSVALPVDGMMAEWRDDTTFR